MNRIYNDNRREILRQARALRPGQQFTILGAVTVARAGAAKWTARDANLAGALVSFSAEAAVRKAIWLLRQTRHDAEPMERQPLDLQITSREVQTQ